MALIAHITAASDGTGAAATTATFDSTGANLIVVVRAVGDNVGAVPISDNKGNTYTFVTSCDSTAANLLTDIYYCYAPTVGAGHTVTVGTGVNAYPAFAVSCWSGAESSPLDQSDAVSGGGSAVSSVHCSGLGVTPVQGQELIVCVMGNSPAVGVTSIDSSLSILDQVIWFPSFGVADAYLIQGVAALINPQWSNTVSGILGAAIATFKFTPTTTPINLTPPSDGLTFSETPKVVETLLQPGFSETLSLTDSVQIQQMATLSINQSESWGFSDILNLVLHGGLTLSESENLNFNDLLTSIHFQFFLKPTETLTFFDILGYQIFNVGTNFNFVGDFIMMIDRIPQLELLSKNRFSDSFSYGDSPLLQLNTVHPTFNETVSWSDSFSMTLTESLNLTPGETLNFNDVPPVLLASTSLNAYFRRYLNDVN